MVRNSVTDIQIYLNPGLIDLIKITFFNGLTGFRYKFKQYYMSSHLELKEPELTIPIVALGATAVSSTFCGCLDYHWLRCDDISVAYICEQTAYLILDIT